MTQNADAERPEPATEAGDQPAEDTTSAQTREAGQHDQAEGDEDAGADR